MNRAHRFIYISMVCAAMFGLLGFLVATQIPKLHSLILVKIEEVSRERLPVRILPSAIELTVFPLGVRLSDVEIIPKEQFATILQSASISHLRVVISPWQLLRGKLRLTALSVEGVRLVGNIPPLEKKSEGPPLAGFFALLNQIPVNELTLRDVNLRLGIADGAKSTTLPNATTPQIGPEIRLTQVEVSNVDLVLEKIRGGALDIDLESGSVQMLTDTVGPEDHGKHQSVNLRIDVATKATLAHNLISVASLAIRRGDSVVEGHGELKGDVEALTFNDIAVDVKTDINLDSTRNWLVRRFPKQLAKMPRLGGRFDLSSEVKKSNGRPLEARLSADTRALKIDKIFLGEIKTKGRYFEHGNAAEIDLPLLTLDHPAGQISLSETHVVLGEKKTIVTRAKAENIQLHELLKSFGVGEIPVYLQVDGEVPCTGQLAPEFAINCKGKATGQNLLLRDSMQSKGTIAALRTFAVEGDVTIDKDKVDFNTELAMPNSKGRSHGVVDYENGFKIFFEGDSVSFKDVANLSDLRFEGTGHLKGMTAGTSKTATFSANGDFTDFWLEDFWLGNVKGDVDYKAGILSFNNMQGYYSVSRYNGDVKLDVGAKEITVNGRAPFYDVRDALKVFSRRVKLPFTATGTGQMQIKASGPLALGKLTYDLKTSAYKGTVAGESFDQAFFDVKSVKGEVNAERVQVSKGTSLVNLTGQAHPDGVIKTVVQARGFHLEDSTFISSTGLSLSGIVDFDMDMNGPVLAPDTVLRGRLTRVSLGDQAMADSTYQLKLSSKAIQGEGSFLSDAVKASFTFPLDPQAPFALKLYCGDWNYAPLFAAFAGPASRKDYEGHLAATVDIASQSGGFWNATGNMRIDKFSLSRGSISLRSTQPASIKMKAGQIHVEQFNLSGGDNTFLKIAESPKPTSKLDLQVSGKLDLNLFGFLTPFLEDLRGVLSLAVTARSGPGGSEVLGSAYVEKGYVKLFEFPHPLEEIRLDMLFNQKKIVFNTVKAELGGGQISGSGGLEFRGPKDYPVSISGQFEKVTLNYPEKVRTTGSGTVSFTGSWFPFLLKIDYDIKDGLWAKEFASDPNETSSLRRDHFLPELLLQERFAPIQLDVGINFAEKGLLIKNELVDGRVNGAISVKGAPSKPSILGRMTLAKDTKISVKDTQFDVTNANIDFDDPNELNPKLYIAAHSRVQEYDIGLLIQGTGKKPDFAFTSVPPLANKDIISLLALGTTEGTRTGPVIQTTTVNQQPVSPSASVGALKNNPLSKEIKEKTGFDVQFSPGFDEQNAVQKIIMKRQFTNNLGVSASQSVGKTRATDAEAKYRINDRVSGVLSWQNRDDLDSIDTSTTAPKEQNQFGLDLEYKFEFK